MMEVHRLLLGLHSCSFMDVKLICVGEKSDLSRQHLTKTIDFNLKAFVVPIAKFDMFKWKWIWG